MNRKGAGAWVRNGVFHGFGEDGGIGVSLQDQVTTRIVTGRNISIQFDLTGFRERAIHRETDRRIFADIGISEFVNI